MKNIFKLMGLALIAGSLAFVSCSKDDDEASIKVNFNNDEEWTSEKALVCEAGTGENVYEIKIYKEDLTQASAKMSCPRATGMYKFADNENYWVVYWDEKDNPYNTANPAYENYINVSDVDLTNQTISGNAAAQFMKVVEGEPTTYDLTIELNNAKWN